MEKTFGQFLAECRQKKGLTQRELADQLYVGESAVSKWEKDKRRPDLELVSRLSEIFGITESELIHASIDKSRAVEKRQARNYRIISNTYNLILLLGSAITVLVCFIVNLAVEGGLTWFFVVVSALALAAIVLLLPQFVARHRLLIIPLAWLGGLVQLLTVCCIFVGGNWLFVPVSALLLAYAGIFLPMLIWKYAPSSLRRHNAVLSICVCFALLLLMLVIIDAYTALDGISFGWSFGLGLPIAGYFGLVGLGIVAIIRYTKIGGWLKSSAVIMLSLVTTLLFSYVILPVLEIEGSGGVIWQANLFAWSSEQLINSNIMLLVTLSAIATSIALAVIDLRKRICK